MLKNRVLRRLMIAAMFFLGFVPDGAQALLCARRNGVVLSRSACKRHEQVVSHSTFVTTRVGPLAVPNVGSDFGTFITPLVTFAVPAGSYAVIGTAFFTNHRPLVDSAACSLTYWFEGVMLAPGISFANAQVVLDGASASGTTISVVGVQTFTNSPTDISLWCTAETPLSMFTAADLSLVAIPVDQVQTQQGG
jgi:hypothetical protein